MHASYDPEADASYINVIFGAEIFSTEERGEGIIVDLDFQGNVIGVEVLGVLKKLEGVLDVQTSSLQEE